MRNLLRAVISANLLMKLAVGAPMVFPEEPMVFPKEIALTTPESSQQLIAWELIDGKRVDRTRHVAYRSRDASIATVSPHGIVEPVSNGKTSIEVGLGSKRHEVPVEISGFRLPPPVSFRRDVQPILTKATCNSGGCHGKAEGQNGFKLSIFGFDLESDHHAITKEGRGRRINAAAPGESLLLKKATALIPHGGGAKLEPESAWFRQIERWISEGAKLDDTTDVSNSLTVTPNESILKKNSGQQLQVFAINANGRRRCVTNEAEYFTNDADVAKVDRNGWVQVQDVPGEAAILVRYRNQVSISRVVLPQDDRFERPREHNLIDHHVWNRLDRLGIQPSEFSSDSEFLRRVFLDVIGTLPTVEETLAFLNDSDSNKREHLIDGLLERKEYGDFWAMKWADLLRIDREIVKTQGTIAMTRWLRRQFNENRPYDELVREIVSVRGNTHAETPAAFYLVHKDPELLARSVSQIFLGVRIECAQCHQHPFEKWGQNDYYAFSGFFTGVGKKGTPGGGTKVFDLPGNDLKHPRTKQPVAAAGLGSPPIEFNSENNRRDALAEWITAPDNSFLSRMFVNRLWAHYLGRGLVEPVDDMRVTNPPSNPELMTFLANSFIESNFDMKRLTKLILMSRTYQLSSHPNESNRRDRQNFSHAAWKPIPAEVLLDAICQVTGIPEEFNGWPQGYRAIQVWDNRMPSYFFRIFGKPQRVSVCECERGNEPSIAQALYLMNAPESFEKIRHRNGRAAKLAKSNLTQDKIIQRLYLAALSRSPNRQEVVAFRKAFAESSTQRNGVEDIMWTLLNTREFVFNH